ncbi:MAG: DUF2155 domain-containing protein [Thermodesulfovibrionia bacterium]
MKRMMIVFTLFFLIITPLSCKKKEEPRQQTMPPAHGVTVPKGELKVVVPDFVKGKWKAVKIEITDKSANKTEEVVTNLNSEYRIPNSNLAIKVDDFLPDFRMEGATITSASNEPKNPAVHVTVTENGALIFTGWLYSKFPSIHPFQHDKFSLRLVEGIKS